MNSYQVDVFIFCTHIFTVKTCTRGHLYKAVTFFLSCLRKFHMNLNLFKRTPVLKDHFSLSQS